jgi:hypothetical protein
VLGTIGVHAFRVGRALPDSRLLDRLLRARAWVLLLGVLLFGLVAMNVSLLKLNAESGRSAETARALAIRNTQLQAKVSRLASGERLQAAARRLGFSMPPPDRVQYLTVRRGDGHRAARAILSEPPIAALSSNVAVPPEQSALPGSEATASPSGSVAPASVSQPQSQSPTGVPDTAAQQAPDGGQTAPASGGQAAPLAGGQPATQQEGSGQPQSGQGG